MRRLVNHAAILNSLGHPFGKVARSSSVTGRAVANSRTTAARMSSTKGGDGGGPCQSQQQPDATAKLGGGGHEPIRFGPFEVTSQVFLRTPHSFALVNLKPLLPGHVLVCPARPHRRLTELTAAELTDLFCAVQRVERMLARHFFGVSVPPAAAWPLADEHGSFNIALQDGPEAGQTVPHVHVHVIPRARRLESAARAGHPDELYDRMAGEDGNVGGKLWDAAREREARERDGGPRQGARPQPGGAFPPVEDADRKPRPMAEMEAEAALFRDLLKTMAEEDEREGLAARQQGR